MEAVAEPEVKPENKKLVPSSNVSMSLKLAAADALARGVKAEDLAKELISSGAVEQAEQKEVEIAEANAAELYDRYLRAFLRYSTGQIEELNTQDMEDIAFLVPKRAVGLNEWKQRRNG